LKNDDDPEPSTAAGGRQQLPARLPDETLRETGPDDPQLQAGSELSKQQDAALVQETAAGTGVPSTSSL
jgi:hypothetical protein